MGLCIGNQYFLMTFKGHELLGVIILNSKPYLIFPFFQGSSEDSDKDSGRNSGKDCCKASGRDSGRDSHKHSGKDCGKDSGRESGKVSGNDSCKDSGREPMVSQRGANGEPMGRPMGSQ